MASLKCIRYKEFARKHIAYCNYGKRLQAINFLSTLKMFYYLRCKQEFIERSFLKIVLAVHTCKKENSFSKTKKKSEIKYATEN